jgi:hypothetical protein
MYHLVISIGLILNLKKIFDHVNVRISLPLAVCHLNIHLPKINCSFLGDMESLSTVVVENLSGCARTDYRSNHALLERVKFRRKLLNYKRGRP